MSSDAADRAPEPAEYDLDYRLTLANERTLLACLRTALGLLTGAVALVFAGAGDRTLRHHEAGPDRARR